MENKQIVTMVVGQELFHISTETGELLGSSWRGRVLSWSRVSRWSRFRVWFRLHRRAELWWFGDAVGVGCFAFWFWVLFVA